MQENHEIDLRNLDVRALTSEQWEQVKTYIIRRAQAERAEAIRELLVVPLRRLLWLRHASRPPAHISNLPCSGTLDERYAGS